MLKLIFKHWYLILPELANNWLVQQEADVLKQVESPCSGRALVHLLLVLGLMRVDAFKDAKSPGNQRSEMIYL